MRLLSYTGKRAYQYYIDGLKVNGKRQRLFFKDWGSANKKLKELTRKTRQEGEDALALSHDFRVLGASETLWKAFAGLRTAEVLRLEWSEVDLVRGFVTVSAHKSKTGWRRLIPIAQNLAEWLRPYAQMSGPVYSTRTRNYHADLDALTTFISLRTWRITAFAIPSPPTIWPFIKMRPR